MKYTTIVFLFLFALPCWSQEIITSTPKIEVVQDSFYYLKVQQVTEIGGPINDTVTQRIFLGKQGDAGGGLFIAANNKEAFISGGLRRQLQARKYSIQGQTENIEIQASYNTLSSLYSDITGRTLADTTRSYYYDFYGVNPINVPDSLHNGIYYRLDDLAANPDSSYICEMIEVGNGTWRLRDTTTAQLWAVIPYSRENFRIIGFRGENYEMIWTRETFSDNRRVYWPTTRAVPNLSAIENTPLKIVRLPR